MYNRLTERRKTKEEVALATLSDYTDLDVPV